MLEAFFVIKFGVFVFFIRRKIENTETWKRGVQDTLFITAEIYIASQSIESIYTKCNGCLPEDDMDKLDEDDDVTGAVKRV